MRVYKTFVISTIVDLSISFLVTFVYKTFVISTIVDATRLFTRCRTVYKTFVISTIVDCENIVQLFLCL